VAGDVPISVPRTHGMGYTIDVTPVAAMQSLARGGWESSPIPMEMPMRKIESGCLSPGW
jgi:hypothetical protein